MDLVEASRYLFIEIARLLAAAHASAVGHVSMQSVHPILAVCPMMCVSSERVITPHLAGLLKDLFSALLPQKAAPWPGDRVQQVTAYIQLLLWPEWVGHQVDHMVINLIPVTSAASPTATIVDHMAIRARDE